jgi:hypothetical protein
VAGKMVDDITFIQVLIVSYVDEEASLRVHT